MASDVEAATALKTQGNKAFAQHDWPAAVDLYSQAIDKYDKEPSFFCNRAQVRFAIRPCVEGRIRTGSYKMDGKNKTRLELDTDNAGYHRQTLNSRRMGLRLWMLPRRWSLIPPMSRSVAILPDFPSCIHWSEKGRVRNWTSLSDTFVIINRLIGDVPSPTPLFLTTARP